MLPKTSSVHFLSGLGHIASHAVITLLALAIAFSVPTAASYVLFNWWPKVEGDAQALLYTELGFAALLVLLFNLVKIAWDFRSQARMSNIASLIYARESDDWLSRWGKEQQFRRLPWKRDVNIMAVTGYGTFAAPASPLRDVLQEYYEIRVMLLNPDGPGAVAYAAAHADPDATLAQLRQEVRSSIDGLRQLRAAGKNVTVRFYDTPPFWKLIFTGEYVWVRCCHNSRDTDKFPEYVFALQPTKPNRGFFPAFYTYFLNSWNNAIHAEYMFDTDELVYRDVQGSEMRRETFAQPAANEVGIHPGLSVCAR